MNHVLIKSLKFKSNLKEKHQDKLQKVAESYLTLLQKKVVHHQVITCELEKAMGSVLGKRSFDQLEHLSIRMEQPKPLASYDPLIEDEFLMRVATKNRFDEKTLKQKAKKTEKDAMRELKKDSFALQKARETERQQRRKVSKRTKVTNIKDEV
jgi:hypothetical protein